MKPSMLTFPAGPNLLEVVSEEAGIPIMPHAHNLPRHASCVQQLDHLPTHLLHSVCLLLFRLAGAAIAQQVRNNQPIASLTEIGNLMSPVVAAGGETMQQEHVRLVVFGCDMCIGVGGTGGEGDAFGEGWKGYVGHCFEVGAAKVVW